MSKKEKELFKLMKLKLGATKDEIFIETFPLEIDYFNKRMDDYYLLIKDWISKIPQFLPKFPDIESYLKSSDPEEVKYGLFLEYKAMEDSQRFYEIYPRTATYSFIISHHSGFESILTEFGDVLRFDFYKMEKHKTNIMEKIKNAFKSADINLNLGHNKYWSEIMYFFKIRNLLVHLNGNISKMKKIIENSDSEKYNHVKQLKDAYGYISKHPEYFDISHEYIIIKIDTEENYCTYTIENFTNILNYLFSCVQTKFEINKR